MQETDSECVGVHCLRYDADGTLLLCEHVLPERAEHGQARSKRRACSYFRDR